MSQRTEQGQPMIVTSEDTQHVSEREARNHNILAARAVADAVRSTLGPKGMDKMLVDSMGSVTVTNDGVTILQEMDIDNPTAEMIVEVAETQAKEAGDGTTTAVVLAGELLKNAEELLEQGIHPTAISNGFRLASESARGEIDEIATAVAPDDEELLQSVAETSMTGTGVDHDKEHLAQLIVDAVRRVSVEADDGETVVDLEFLNIETNTGSAAKTSTLVDGAILEKSPTYETMPDEARDANVLLLDQQLEADQVSIDTNFDVADPEVVKEFVDREDEQLEVMIERIVELGADVVFCGRNIDTFARHHLANAGVLVTRHTADSDLEFLSEVLEGSIVSDLDSATTDDLGHGDVRRNEDDETFHVTGGGHGATLILYGSTDHVVDELERSVNDALDVVAQTASNGRVLAGGGAIEVELASRLRDYADSVSGREQLAIEAFADALELVPWMLAKNAGIDPIDALVALRTAHGAGDELAGLDVYSGEVENTFEIGAVEPAHAKQQALSSATEAANLVLKIDDIISAGDLSTDGEEDDDTIHAPGDDMGGMGGGMGGMM